MSVMRNDRMYVNKDNSDVFDTLNDPFMESIPTGMVADTQENRLNAALACIYAVAKNLRRTQNELYELKQSLNQPDLNL